ncbi:hypothetical protein KFL_005690090 [Klebsormidium nitens]|uniref:Uncharacterized protein n=1 Tax=Klebsormidium nitens TaxID=105231 RepID=A0A1Y1IG77_KLENI|nr:hypothetical protein KFL_005690090 [Klebsormidium nitens]|eukprot:GAQ89855.1 hypothetical protein KFL_005690090 [Klebsormidium nitens]
MWRHSWQETCTAQSSESASFPASKEAPLGLLLERLNSRDIMMPLKEVQKAFIQRKATVFVLRIMKTGSTGLQAIFSTRNQAECSPHLQKELKLPENLKQHCNRLYKLLNEAVFDPQCLDMRGWDAPEWVQPDCLPFISGDYESHLLDLRHVEQDRIYF